MGIIGLLLLFLLHVGRTWRATFVTWPANAEVQFVWQQALTDMAGYLDGQLESTPVAIGGWTPESMDPPTMELTLRRDDLMLRFFDPGRAVIIPTAGPDRSVGGGARLMNPTDLPLHPALAQQLSSLGVQPVLMDTFTYYEVDDAALSSLDGPPLATFGGELSLLAYECTYRDEMLELIAIWRVEGPVNGERRIFFHFVDESGDIVAQDDGLGAPAAHWQAGDIIIQRQTIDRSLVSDTGTLLIGLYDPQTGHRFQTTTGASSFILQPG